MLNKAALTILFLTAIVMLSLGTSVQQTVVGLIPAEFNVANGTANYSIPIAAALGRGGMQP